MEEVYCRNCGEKIRNDAEICPKCGCRQLDNSIELSLPQKSIYIILAILLGMLGIHNFYTQAYGRGFTKIALTLFLGWCGIGFIINFIWIVIEIIACLQETKGWRN
jgi:TM2 domain-containing membrane protein YozV